MSFFWSTGHGAFAGVSSRASALDGVRNRRVPCAATVWGGRYHDAMAASTLVLTSIDDQPTFVDAGRSGGRRRLAVWGDGAVRLLNDRLQELDTRAFELSAEPRLLAAQGVDRLALCTDAGLLVAGDSTVIVDGLVADSAAYVGDGLLVTAKAKEGHRVLLLDPATGEVLEQTVVDADHAAGFITPHPSEPVALIELAMGQDGCVAFRADVDRTTFRLTEVLAGQDPVIAGFSPSGNRLLVVPHPSDPDAVRVLAWPTLDEVGRLTAEELDTEIGMGLPGCWVDEDRIAVYAMEDALVLTDGELTEPVRVTLALDFGDNGDLESLIPLAPGRVAAGVWTPKGRSTLVMEIWGL